MVTLRVNGTSRVVDVDLDTALLWVLRDDLRLTGTKFGCDVADLPVDGRAHPPPLVGHSRAPRWCSRGCPSQQMHPRVPTFIRGK